MTKEQYTQEQTISMLKEHEAGASVPELPQRHATADNTGDRSKSEFGSMTVSEAKRSREREFEQESARLKRLLGETELDKSPLKQLVEGHW